MPDVGIKMLIKTSPIKDLTIKLFNHWLISNPIIPDKTAIDKFLANFKIIGRMSIFNFLTICHIIIRQYKLFAITIDKAMPGKSNC
jgi:hypothetical protein